MKSLSTPIFALIICGVLPFAESSSADNLEKLTLKMGYASSTWNDQYNLGKSLDDDPSTFFFTGTYTNEVAEYYIPESNVALVRIQNRQDCCGFHLTDSWVSVCSESTGMCEMCGRITTTVENSAWVEIRCSLRGNTVTVRKQKGYLQIAEIEVFAEADPQELDIISGEGSERNENTRIENAFDGNEGTTKKECYFNDKNEPKEARFKLNREAEVEIVKLLGRAEVGRNNWNMAETVVEVCTGISDCKPCGTVTVTPPMGEYAEVQCAEGAQGDTVRLTSESRTKYLQICEIKVLGFGQTTNSPVVTEAPSQSLEKLTVNKAYSSRMVSGHDALKAWDNDPSTFVLADDSTTFLGAVTYPIPESNVALIRIQNRADCCEEGMTGIVVTVCDRNVPKWWETCPECGRVTTRIERSGWVEMRCSLSGNTVRVEATNSYLQFAEIEIFTEAQ